MPCRPTRFGVSPANWKAGSRQRASQPLRQRQTPKNLLSTWRAGRFLSRDRTWIPDLLRHDRSDAPIPEQDSGLARLRESKTNIVIKGKRADFDSLRVPQGPGAPRESVATVMSGTRWDHCLRKPGLRRAQVIQTVGY